MNKKIKILLIAMACVMLLAGCTQGMQPEPTQQPENTQQMQPTKQPENTLTEGPQTRDEVMMSLVNAAPSKLASTDSVQYGLNLALLKKLSETEGGNLFYSPLSISTALTMAYFGACGETQQQMADVLGYNSASMADVAAYQKYISALLSDTGDTQFNSANSVWVAESFVPNSSYIDTMKDVFDTKVSRVDFTGDTAIDELNGWISDATQGMIDEMFDKEDEPFDALTVMVLLNAIYFNGNWSEPFDPDKTYDTDFNGATATESVRMMSSREEVRGYQGEDYVSVRLPYGADERFAMIAVLPDDMEAFIAGLDAQSFKDLTKILLPVENPVVNLPVFEMEQKVKLNDVLNALGMDKAFSESEADFTTMAGEDILWIDEVLHAAKITVDEEGTEAAAATSVEILARSMPMESFEFIADRPFLFFIMDTQNDLVLFTGKVMDLG